MSLVVLSYDVICFFWYLQKKCNFSRSTFRSKGFNKRLGNKSETGIRNDKNTGCTGKFTLFTLSP